MLLDRHRIFIILGNSLYFKAKRRHLMYSCFVVITYTYVTVNGNVHFHTTNPNEYQLLESSFKDIILSITQKLDHFVDLGIETLCFGPFFKSPIDDMGYDFQDFYTIDPIFRTMDDLEEFVFEMNQRITSANGFKNLLNKKENTKIITFKRNASNQNELSNSSITPKTPNNWLSTFGRYPLFLGQLNSLFQNKLYILQKLQFPCFSSYQPTDSLKLFCLFYQLGASKNKFVKNLNQRF
ncbi:hypothetical protein QTP88_022315 [Uroleucon formosanum]